MRNRTLSLFLRQTRALPWVWGLAALVPSASWAALPPARSAAPQALLAEGPAEPQTPATLEAALRALADQADVIFTGEVSSITRTAGAVEVRWQVDDAVRGAAAGQVYVLREWAGLWQSDEARYVKGERALLLLHAPSVGGYTSPVGGSDGVIALRGDRGSGTLDLRLLQQRVQVTDAARLRPLLALRAAGGSIRVSNALQQESAAQEARKTLATQAQAHRGALVRLQPGLDGSTTTVVRGTPTQAESRATTVVDPNSHVDAGMVVDMLRAWQRGAAK